VGPALATRPFLPVFALHGCYLFGIPSLNGTVGVVSELASDPATGNLSGTVRGLSVAIIDDDDDDVLNVRVTLTWMFCTS
jgi:hypothetical protein